MHWLYIALIIVASLFLLSLILLWAAFLLTTRIFSRRQDKQPDFHYFEASDFPNMTVTRVELVNAKNKKLRGYIYEPKEGEVNQEEMIIFFSGVGMGHKAYTRQIVDLASENNLRVLGMDYQGCDESEGRSTRGFYRTLYDAADIIRYVEENYKGVKIHLIGHSWGGFLSGNVLSIYESTQVETITILAAPNSLPDVFLGVTGSSVIKKLILWLFAYISFGKLANIKTVKSIANNKVKTLVIHGREDQVVTYPRSGRLYINTASEHKHIRPLIFDNKGHLVYLDTHAEMAQNNLMKEYHAYKKDRDKQLEFISNVDWSEVTNSDETVLAVIKDLLGM